MRPGVKAFNPEPKCEKCGSTDIIRRYCKGLQFPYSHCHGSYREGIDIACPGAEHHDLHCRNCQYGWLEELAPVEGGTPGDR